VEHFRDVHDKNAMKIATRIHKDKVHVLVDLDGHTESLVTEVMALRPAPIQIHYPMRYPGTMGADFVDYALVDTSITEEDEKDKFTESLIRFQHRPFLVCEHAHTSSSAKSTTEEKKEEDEENVTGPTRSSEKLPEGKIVLACFAQHHKINPSFFDMISRVLKKCSNAVLWLLKWTEDGEKNLKQEMTKRGISADRVVFSDVVPRAEHLRRCFLADLYIDTVLVSSVSTICDVLWSGTPAVTVRGQDLARRTAASALSSVMLEDNICKDLSSYEARILSLVHDPHYLHDMRAKLESNKQKYKLFDTVDCARTLEKAYSKVWNKYEWGESPSSVVV